MKIKGFKHQWTIYFLPLFTLGIVLTFMNSCSSEEQNELAQVKKSQFYVISNLSVQEYNALTLKINNFIKFSSRSNGNEVTETEAQELLKPLINDGYNIQRQIISNTEDLGLTFEETENIQNFTDDQLAELSFVLNTICSDASAKGVSFNDIIDCLSRAANMPEQMIQNIAKGRLGKFLKEVCLLRQESIMDSKQTVADVLKADKADLTVTDFKRFTLRAE